MSQDIPRQIFPRLDKTATRSKKHREPDEFGKFIRNIRDCPCLICGAQAEAAHLRMSDARYKKLNGRSHRWITPLCPQHHRLGRDSQHGDLGESGWWQFQQIDPLPIAQALWDARNNLEKMIQISLNRG